MLRSSTAHGSSPNLLQAPKGQDLLLGWAQLNALATGRDANSSQHFFDFLEKDLKLAPAQMQAYASAVVAEVEYIKSLRDAAVRTHAGSTRPPVQEGASWPGACNFYAKDYARALINYQFRSLQVQTESPLHVYNEVALCVHQTTSLQSLTAEALRRFHGDTPVLLLAGASYPLVSQKLFRHAMATHGELIFSYSGELCGAINTQCDLHVIARHIRLYGGYFTNCMGVALRSILGNARQLDVKNVEITVDPDLVYADRNPPRSMAQFFNSSPDSGAAFVRQIEDLFGNDRKVAAINRNYYVAEGDELYPTVHFHLGSSETLAASKRR